MAKTYLIHGSKELSGEVIISGSKNCALALIAGALLTNEEMIIENIPCIKDIETFIRILSYLNIKTEFNNNILKINASTIENKSLCIDDVKKFRASYYLIGSLINRFKKLEISKAGGCNFVNRPINYHLDLLKNFGVDYLEKEDNYYFDYHENDIEEYTLPYPSFGTTINGILFAISSKKNITLKNICTEIEILHFIDMIKKMGGKLTLVDKTLYIERSVLHGIRFKNIPDRIETGTFLLMGPTICSYLKIKNINPLHNRDLLDLFSLLDIDYILGEDYVVLRKTKINKSCLIETGEKISSDLQPLLTVFCLAIPRISVIKEKVYSSRFTHVNPLKKMGGAIYESNQNILINGIMTLQGQELYATDLRMAASMVYACLLAEGKSVIHNMDYIDRGYENFVDKLNSLGADIKIYEE